MIKYDVHISYIYSIWFQGPENLSPIPKTGDITKALRCCSSGKGWIYSSASLVTHTLQYRNLMKSLIVQK